MFGSTPVYNETTRKVIIAFGAIFNNMYIRRVDETGTLTRKFKVPLSYADSDKMLKLINKQMDQNESKVGQILPRLSFWIESIEPDTERMAQKNLKYRMVKDGSDFWIRRTPWTISLSLMAIGRFEEDVLQIVEQIYPEFQPSIGITVKPVAGVDFSEDYNLRLSNVVPMREQENVDTTRFVAYTLNFTLPVWFYTQPTEGNLIRKSVVEYNVEKPINEDPTYEISYTVDPFDADQEYDWEVIVDRTD